MKKEYLKILWMLRFEKIKKNEDDAAWGYQEMMDACLEALGPEHQAVKLLKQLVREEREHSKLADRLIKIGRETHPEFGIA